MSAQDELDFPSGDQVARAVVMGSVCVALCVTALTPFLVDSARVAWSTRLLTLMFTCVATLGWGCLLGVGCFFVHWALARAGARAGWFWLVMALILSTALFPLLSDSLHRRAIVLVDNLGLPVPSGYLPVARVLEHGGAGFGLMLALYFGLTAAGIENPRGARWVTRFLLLLGVSVAVGQHFVFNDEYEDIHALCLAAAVCILGGALGRAFDSRLVAHRRHFLLGSVASALLLLIPTPNLVRLEMFRLPGAGGAFLQSQVAWSMPDLDSRAANSGYESTRAAQEDGSRQGPAPQQSQTSPQGLDTKCVVLLTLDALRADVFDARYEKRFPELFHLKQTGIYFTRAITPGSQTSVSLTSLFSGKYFSELSWGLYGEGTRRREYAAGDATPRLAEVLGRSNVQSMAVLSPGFLSGEFGIARGFTEERIVAQTRHARAKETLAPILERLRKREPGHHFLFTHVMDAHEPYDRGELKTGSDFDRYLSEVELLDGWVGRVRRALERSYGGQGVLILSTDHGEAFGEHETRFHSKTLYQELIHVPLIVWRKGGARVVSSAPVGVIDIGSTVMGLFGVEVPRAHRGENLLRAAFDPHFARKHPRVAEGRLRRAYFDEATGLKVIENLRRKTSEVYDLKSDPGELRNIFGQDERVDAAVAASRSFFKGMERPPLVYKR